MSNKYLKTLILCVIFRMCCLISNNSYYHPDEYWQSVEVAHRLVFGNGYLTWEWIYAIRSYLYVGWIAVLFYGLKIFGIDSVWNVVWLPHIVQGIFTTIGDTYFIAWVHKVSARGQAYWSVWFYMTNVYLAYLATRTITNTIETNITCIALYYYPWTERESGSVKYVWWICMAFIIRPTSAVIWTPLCIYQLIDAERRSELKLLLTKFIHIGLTALTISTLIDSYMNGEFVLTWWNFLKFNIIYNISSWFSTSPAEWYLIEALPTVLGPCIVPFCITMVQKLLNNIPVRDPVFNKIAITFVFILAVFSAIPHKECRFILPLVPMAAYIASFSVHRWTSSRSKMRTYLLVIIKLTGLVSAYVFYFISYNRNVAQIKVMDHLHSPNNNVLILYCFSTPFYSHIHLNIPARNLRCEPNIEQDPKYVSELTQFNKNPMEWLENQYPEQDGEKLPTHIVCDEFRVLNISQFLKSRQYEKVEEFGISVDRLWLNANRSIYLYERNATSNLK